MRVPWWGVASAVLAPVFLISGWTVAAALQPAGYSPARDPISSLAGLGATDRWVMTAGFVGTGLSHLVTALALRPAALAGRLVLATGGAATVMLAAFPVPAVGFSTPHRLIATAAFAALAVWPALAWRRGLAVPWALRPGPAGTATVFMVALLGWFGAQFGGDAGLAGLAERLAAGAQALWPLVVVVSATIAAPGGATRPAQREPAQRDATQREPTQRDATQRDPTRRGASRGMRDGSNRGAPGGATSRDYR
jgi:hypothetical membrane protein